MHSNGGHWSQNRPGFRFQAVRSNRQWCQRALKPFAVVRFLRLADETITNGKRKDKG